MRGLRSQDGQTAAEYAGMLLVAGVVVTALIAGSVPQSIAGGARDAICRIVALEVCGADAEVPPPSCDELTDRYTRAPLDEFLDYRNSAERDGRLDFSTDGCSAPVVGSTGLSFDFTDACLRHDFGYRNYKALGHFDATRRTSSARGRSSCATGCATCGPSRHRPGTSGASPTSTTSSSARSPRSPPRRLRPLAARATTRPRASAATRPPTG